MATIRRLMQGVGHTVPCNTSRQAALQARWVGYTVSLPIEARVISLVQREGGGQQQQIHRAGDTHQT
eukprot:COSAG01_NODE_1029_length_12019_cov_560.144631_15_plen_67_part_00